MLAYNPAMKALAPKVALGIDPGKHGAVASVYLRKQSNYPITLMTIDTTEYGLKDIVLAVCSKYEITPQEIYAIVEQQVPFAKGGRFIGATSSMSIGVGVGRILGVFEAMEVEHHLALPQQWQKALSRHTGVKKEKSEDTKDAAARMFAALYPEFVWRDISDDNKKGCIDAALIASFGRFMLKPAMC